MAFLLLLAFLIPQDALQRAAQAPPPQVSVRRDRLDLRLGPMIDPSRCTVPPAKVSVDLKIAPDFACGSFDLSAGYRSIFTKSVREEMLGALIESARAEIAGSAMVLACQMSPTLCDAMKHYKIVASDALALGMGQCRAVESASSGVSETLRARAIKQCLAELQAKGVPFDDALRECQQSRQLRGLTGSRVEEIDLVREVSKALGLSSDSTSLISEVAGGASYRAEGVSGSVRLRPVADLFERIRRTFEEGWNRAVEDPARDTGAHLVPAGAPPASSAEVQRLALLPAPDRRIVIGSLASALALQETSRRLSEAQAALESAAAIAADPAMERKLRSEIERLASEFRRLREEYELSELVARARLRAEVEIRAGEAAGFRRATEPWRRAARAEEAGRASAPWGSGCPVEKRK